MVTLVRRAPTSRRALGSFVMCSGKSKFRTFSVKHGTCARFEMTAGGDVASGRRKGVRNICLNAKIGGNVECKKGARPWPTKFELASRSETVEVHRSVCCADGLAFRVLPLACGRREGRARQRWARPRMEKGAPASHKGWNAAPVRCQPRNLPKRVRSRRSSAHSSVADAEQTRSCEKRAVDTVRHGIHIRKHFNTPIEI